LLIGLWGWTASVVLFRRAKRFLRCVPAVHVLAVIAGARPCLPLARPRRDAEVSARLGDLHRRHRLSRRGRDRLGVAALLSVDSLWRAIRHASRTPAPLDPLCLAAHTVYLGGLSGGFWR